MTAPPEDVRTELERVLESDRSRLGDVYRATSEGLSADQIARRLKVETSGFVWNYKTMLAAILDGSVPTKPAIAKQIAAKVRTVLRVSTVSSETRDYLTGILAQLEPVVASGGQAANARTKPENAGNIPRAGTLRHQVEEEVRRRVRALVEVISTEIDLEADDYAAVWSALSPMDELARVVMLQSAGRTFVSLSKAGRLDLTLESGVIAWSEDLPLRSDVRNAATGRLDYYGEGDAR